MQRSDLIHLMLMLAALAAAYLLPFELLLLAYVVLGPAHYLTEISWLHDRNYFLPHRGIAVGLVILAVILAVTTNTSWLGFLIWIALVACALIVATTSAAEGALLFMVALGVSLLMYAHEPSLAMVGILLPTLVHVSVFTLVFMVLGAYRSRSRAQAGLVAVYLCAIVLILLVPPTAEVRIPALAAASREYFENVGPALGKLFGIPDLTLNTRLTSLLAFVYTYHYLNWFIKADVIRWSDVPRHRLAMIFVASAASTGLYFYSYTLGFVLLLALSLAHVLLEFPLNAMSVRQLGSVTLGGFRQAFAGSNQGGARKAPRKPRR